MKTKKTKLFALLACLFMLSANHVQAQDTDALQSLIDNLAKVPATRAGTPTDIDLSAYSEPRTATLYIRNGVNVRFINGTLTRAKSLTNAPLVQIIGSSTLHVAKSATISGGNFVTDVTLVEVKDGELDVEGGKVIGNNEKTSTSSHLSFSVTLTDAKAVVQVDDGEIEYLYQYQTAKASIMNINGGTFRWIYISGHATMKGIVNSAISFRGKDTYIELTNGILDYHSSLKLYDCEDGQVAVRNVLSKQTADRFELGYGDKDKFDLIYENNCLVVRSKTPTDPNLIYNEGQLSSRLREIADNKESSASKPVKLTVAPEGFTISSSVFISNCYVELTGGRLTIVKNTGHSPFGIMENAGLTLDNIEIDFNNIAAAPKGISCGGGYLNVGTGAVFLNVPSTNSYSDAFYYLYKGTVTISPTFNNVANKYFTIYFASLSSNEQVLFTSAVSYAQITGSWRNYNSDEPYTLIKGSGYTLKESDFKNMYFMYLPDDLEVYYDENDYSVKLRKKTDPNYITNEDWLQKRLDEIAAEKPSEPVTLTIREEGITLTKSILAQSGCKVIITGGRISTPKSMSKESMIFYLAQGADITFKDITLELCNLQSDQCYHFFSYGHLTFDNTEVIVDKFKINGECRIYGYTRMPMLYLSSQSWINLLSAMQDTWIIDGDWTNFNVDDTYMIVLGNSYTVTADDYSRMQFANLPDDIEIVYNDNYKAVVLQKRKKSAEDVLQCLVDGGTNCVPDETEVKPGITEVGCEDPLQCKVDGILEGEEKTDPNTREPYYPYFRWCGCVKKPEIGELEIIRINLGSSLTVRNLNFTADKYDYQYILVRGTLTIDVNVYIHRFYRFIHIMPGGRVIWRGGHVEDVDEIVYNQGGTLEIEGDFDNGGKRFVNPEGGTLIIRGGTFYGDIENYGTLIVEGGTIQGRIDNYGDFRMSGGTIVGGGEHEINNHSGGKLVIEDGCDIGYNGTGCIWSETDIWIQGGVRVMDIHIKRGCRIHVIGRLKVIWRIHFYVFDEFEVYVPFVIGDEGYTLTEEDYNHLQIELPEGYRWIYHEGSIVIVRIPYDVVTIVEYLDYFGPQGTPGHPWSFVYNTTNININIDWHILKDYHLIFDGGTFTMNGGDIYIDEGASLWLKNIKFKGVDQHIYVYGTLYIDENVDFAEIVRFIHICKGGEIRFVTKPEYIVNIIVEEEHVVTDVAVIYDIIKEWLEYLHIDIPDGYEWKYDDTTHTITISFAAGINGVLMDDNVDEPIYDMSGKRQAKPQKGLNIINGKKVVVK